MERRDALQRLFTTFPGGWPGIGLLLLRSALGVPAILQGGILLADGTDSGQSAPIAAGVVLLLTGLALAIGFFAPVSSAVAGLAIAGLQTGWLPAPSTNLFGTGLATVLASVMALAIVPLGPGAFSIDGWRFGRRVIIIPPRHRDREE